MKAFKTPSLAGRRALLLAMVSAAALTACGGGEDDNFDDRADIADPKLRFVHAVPAGANVSLVRNGAADANATNVPYKFGSQYYTIPTGNTVLSLRATATNTELATFTFDARRGDRYTVVALATTSGVQLLVIDDPYNKSVVSDNARVRWVNASSNAPSVDVYITAPAVDLAMVGPRIAALGYSQVSPTTTNDSITLEGASYAVSVTATTSKTPIFNATLTIPKNADWLFLTLPDDGALATPNRIRVLLVRADDTADATDEYVSP